MKQLLITILLGICMNTQAKTNPKESNIQAVKEDKEQSHIPKEDPPIIVPTLYILNIIKTIIGI